MVSPEFWVSVFNSPYESYEYFAIWIFSMVNIVVFLTQQNWIFLFTFVVANLILGYHFPPFFLCEPRESWLFIFVFMWTSWSRQILWFVERQSCRIFLNWAAIVRIHIHLQGAGGGGGVWFYFSFLNLTRIYVRYKLNWWWEIFELGILRSYFR